MLEMDFAINRDGVVDPVHEQRYSEFGDWIRGCYGTPVSTAAQAVKISMATMIITMTTTGNRNSNSNSNTYRYYNDNNTEQQ